MAVAVWWGHGSVGEGHLLLLQRTHLQFPAPTQCSQPSTDSRSDKQRHQACTYLHAGKHSCAQNKINLKTFKGKLANNYLYKTCTVYNNEWYIGALENVGRCVYIILPFYVRYDWIWYLRWVWKPEMQVMVWLVSVYFTLYPPGVHRSWVWVGLGELHE